MINKEIQDYIDYLLFLKYDRQLVWSNTTKEKYSEFCKRVYTRYL